MASIEELMKQTQWHGVFMAALSFETTPRNLDGVLISFINVSQRGRTSNKESYKIN
jgi:hypothetical protein